MRQLFWGILFTGNLFSARAQRNCLTEEYLKNHPVTVISGTSTPTGVQRDTGSNEIIIIPVVVHLLYKTGEQNISDDRIKSQIDALNNDFRRTNADAAGTPTAFKLLAGDAKINFCLAQVAPNGQRTKGIIRKYTAKDYFTGDDAMKFGSAGGDDAWDSKRYLNIWVCNLYGRALGYATLPGQAADKDGVVINWDVFGTIGNLRQPFTKGRTATHEVAHWLGLKHIWGDAQCGDDGIADTPPQSNYNFGCTAFPKISSCSVNGNGDMFMNYMDFSDDACMNLFTNGQIKKMRSQFAMGGARNFFLNSYACDSMQATGGPMGDPIATDPFSIRIYPNPVADMVYVDCKNGSWSAGRAIRIFNLQGIEVLRTIVYKNTNGISLKQLSSGVYLLRVEEGEDKLTAKIFKQ